MNLLRTTVVLGALLQLFPIQSVSGTAEKKQAKTKFEEGLTLAEAEDFAGAAVLFKESIALYPTKSALYNLAMAYKFNNQFVEALETLNRLKREYAGNLKPEMRRGMESDLPELAKLVARLKIAVEPPGAEIYVNGKPAQANAKGEILLNPGTYELTVSLAGHEPATRSVTVASGAFITEHLTLEETPAEADAGSVASSQGGPIPTQTTATDMNGDSSPSGKRARSALFWTSVGGTVATGVASAVFLGLAKSRADSFFDYDTQLKGREVPESEMDQVIAKRDRADADARKYSQFGLGFGAAAGVFAVAATTLFLVKYGKSDYAKSACWTITPNGIAGSF